MKIISAGLAHENIAIHVNIFVSIRYCLLSFLNVNSHEFLFSHWCVFVYWGHDRYFVCVCVCWIDEISRITTITQTERKQSILSVPHPYGIMCKLVVNFVYVLSSTIIQWNKILWGSPNADFTFVMCWVKNTSNFFYKNLCLILMFLNLSYSI